MTVHKEPRRANLATIVGSSLAVVAAGSLLAFSSLAEQAGLQGLATGGIQPARPGRTSGGGHAITIPAPATDPRDALAELVRETGSRARLRTFTPLDTAVPEVPELPETVPPPPQETPEPERLRRVDGGARVAFDTTADEAPERDGPPYGHAYGYHWKKHAGPEPARKHAPKDRSAEQPVHARSTNDDGAKPAKKSKGPALQKVEKAKKDRAASPGNGKAKGHSKHGNGNGRGHSKHAHKGKGKGHSKHGG